MVSRMTKKNKILIISIVGVIAFSILFGIIMSSSSSNKEEKTPTYNKKKNEDTKQTIVQTKEKYFEEDQSYVLVKSYNGTKAYITFKPDYTCEVDFIELWGKGNAAPGAYVSTMYPELSEKCGYSIKDDVVSVYYGGTVRRMVTSGGNIIENSYTPIMPGIKFKYNSEDNSIDMTPINGKWIERGSAGGSVIYFISEDSEEYKKEKAAEEQAKKEKEEQKKKEEQDELERIKNDVNNAEISVNGETTDSTGDKETIGIYVEHKERIKSVKVNGQEIINQDSSLLLPANRGPNTFTITITGDQNITRTETITYTFDPTPPKLEDSFWGVSCYVKLWNYTKAYNDLDKISIYYDGISLENNPNVRHITNNGDHIFLYSKGGTHTLKTVNKYGVEYEREYPFPDDCDEKEIHY